MYKKIIALFTLGFVALNVGAAPSPNSRAGLYTFDTHKQSLRPMSTEDSPLPVELQPIRRVFAIVNLHSTTIRSTPEGVHFDQSNLCSVATTVPVFEAPRSGAFTLRGQEMSCRVELEKAGVITITGWAHILYDTTSPEPELRLKNFGFGIYPMLRDETAPWRQSQYRHTSAQTSQLNLTNLTIQLQGATVFESSNGEDLSSYEEQIGGTVTFQDPEADSK